MTVDKKEDDATPAFPVGIPPILQKEGLRGTPYSTDTCDLLVALVPLVRTEPLLQWSHLPRLLDSARGASACLRVHPCLLYAHCTLTCVRLAPPLPDQATIVAGLMAWVFTA